MEFSFPFPLPKVGNAIFHCHSRSQSLGMGWAIPVPVSKCPKVIPAHPCLWHCLCNLQMVERIMSFRNMYGFGGLWSSNSGLFINLVLRRRDRPLLGRTGRGPTKIYKHGIEFVSMEGSENNLIFSWIPMVVSWLEVNHSFRDASSSFYLRYLTLVPASLIIYARPLFNVINVSACSTNTDNFLSLQSPQHLHPK